MYNSLKIYHLTTLFCQSQPMPQNQISWAAADYQVVGRVEKVEQLLSLKQVRVLVFVQFTTSSRRLDGGAYCGAPVGGK